MISIIVSEPSAPGSTFTIKAVLDVVLHLNLDVYTSVMLSSVLPLFFQAFSASLHINLAHHDVKIQPGPLVHSNLILEQFPIDSVVFCL